MGDKEERIVIEKPQTISWNVIHDLLWAAHKKS